MCDSKWFSGSLIPCLFMPVTRDLIPPTFSKEEVEPHRTPPRSTEFNFDFGLCPSGQRTRRRCVAIECPASPIRLRLLESLRCPVSNDSPRAPGLQIRTLRPFAVTRSPLESSEKATQQISTSSGASRCGLFFGDRALERPFRTRMRMRWTSVS